MAALRQSADWLARHHEAFAGQLHRDLARLIPGSAVPPSFDMAAFCARMTQALLWAARTDQPPHVVTGKLRKVGAQNWLAGFPDDQYADVARALIQTVRHLLRNDMPNDWSTSTGSTWISFFMRIKPHVLAGARQAAATTETAAHQVITDVRIEQLASILDEDDAAR
jgi:hypothetical protein